MTLASHRTVPVLLYHSVCTEPAPLMREWAISPARFSEHLAFLTREGYETLTVTDYVALLDTPVHRCPSDSPSSPSTTASPTSPRTRLPRSSTPASPPPSTCRPVRRRRELVERPVVWAWAPISTRARRLRRCRPGEHRLLPSGPSQELRAADVRRSTRRGWRRCRRRQAREPRSWRSRRSRRRRWTTGVARATVYQACRATRRSR